MSFNERDDNGLQPAGMLRFNVLDTNFTYHKQGKRYEDHS